MPRREVSHRLARLISVTSEAKPHRLYLVASTGGHLELLTAVAPILAAYELTWITPESKRARALEAGGDRLETVPFYGRNPFRLLRHLRRVVPLVARERPQVVLTTGAGPAVPFCLLARLFGARIVFIETMARVTNASISGSILSRIAYRVMVQWPDMRNVYRGAQLCQPALLSDVRPRQAPTGAGTFVAVGTHVQPFDRLLSAVDDALGRGVLPAPATGQSGVSRYEARHLDLSAFMPPADIDETIEQARYVVCHAGSGLIASALRAGHRPIVMPRLKRHGEHVDDHQLQIANKLEEVGLVVCVDGELTAAHLTAADAALDPARLKHADEMPSISEALAACLEDLDGDTPSRPAPKRWVWRKSARRHAVDEA